MTPKPIPSGEPWGQLPIRLLAEYGPVAAGVWMTIRRRMGPHDEPATMSLAHLAIDQRISLRTVNRAVYRLIAAGWLEVRQTGRESLLSAVISTAEHIEKCQKSPIRSAKRALSEVPKEPYQKCQKRPIATPPLIIPPCKQQKGGRGEEREAAPPPARTLTGKTDTAAADPGDLGGLAREFRRRQVNPEPLEAILGVLAEDLHLKRYRVEDLRLVIETLPAIDARVWRLRERVVALAAAIRHEQFLARLKVIQDGRMILAWRRSTPSVRARVERVDVLGGKIVLVEWSAGGEGDRRVIESGRDLDAWGFAREEPTLFPLGDAPPPAQVAPPRPAEPVRLPEEPVARAAAEQLLAAIGPQRYRAWFGEAVWVAGEEGISVDFPNEFVRDYAALHFAPDLRRAAREALGADRAVVFRSRARAKGQVPG